MWARLGLAGLLVALGSTAGLTAQADFETLYAKAVGTDPGDAGARRRAFLAAFDAFSRLPVDGASYRAVLPRGAASALHGGRFADAVGLLEQQWRSAGPSSALLTRRLVALAGAGQSQAAVVLARKHQESHAAGVTSWLVDRKTVVARMGDADQLLLLGNTSDGLWLFEALVQAFRGNSNMLANLALAKRRLGRFAAARRDYQKVLKSAPGADWLWCDYGLLLKGQGQREAAVKAFIEGLKCETKPGVSPAATNLGVLAVRTGKSRGRKPVQDLTSVLRARPRAQLARRVQLDLLARKSR